MYVIIGIHFVPLEGKFLLIALVIVRITLNVIVHQMPLNVRKTTVCPSFKNLLSNSQTLRQCYFYMLWKRCRSVWEFDNNYLNDGHTVVYRPFRGIWCTITFNVILTITNAISKNLPSSGTKWIPIMTYIHPCFNHLSF
jgi:hypothetical protein